MIGGMESKNQANPMNSGMESLNQNVHIEQPGLIEIDQQRKKDVGRMLNKISEKFSSAKEGKVFISKEEVSNYKKLEQKLEKEKKEIADREKLIELKEKYRKSIEAFDRIEEMIKGVEEGNKSVSKEKLIELKEKNKRYNKSLELKIRIAERMISEVKE